jgi:NTE family protein
LNPASTENLALVLSGGGARAAYQVGFLRSLAEYFPDIQTPVITGLSAGAINAAFLANHPGSFREAIEALAGMWCCLTPDQIFRVNTRSLLGNIFNWAYHLLSGGFSKSSRMRGIVNTDPLRKFLNDTLDAQNGNLIEIERKLARGDLKAVAITTTSYMTGQNITWTQGCELQNWQRPNQVSIKTRLTVDHIMASASIPIFFPAVKIDKHWHGDGGIRLYAPLSPAIHLGADRILAISTRYGRSRAEADQPVILDYPPPAQIAGVLMNAIFLDLLDQDADRLERTNRLLEKLPEDEREGRRVIKLFILRPSQDLGRLAAQFEPKLPRLFRTLMRGQGTQTTSSPDWLSMVMFQTDYLSYLVELGARDAEAKRAEIEEFFK